MAIVRFIIFLVVYFDGKLLLLPLAVVIHISEIISFLYNISKNFYYFRQNDYLCGQLIFKNREMREFFVLMFLCLF